MFSFFKRNTKKRVQKLSTAWLQARCGVTTTCFREVTSTNAILKEYAKQNAPAWTMVVAESQTAGKGRGEHTFFSPLGSGVYISILLRLKTGSFQPADITAAAGVAACEAIESLSDQKCDIKWMNDVLIEGKKVCGILAESLAMGSERVVVVGAGFNLIDPDGGFPEEIKDTAASVFGEREIGSLREKLTVAFFRRLEALIRNREENVYRAYRDRLFVFGKTVYYEGREATVTDLASDYRLELTFRDGEKKLLDSGEISLSSMMSR